MREAIETLPEDIKKAVVLHYFVDMPVRDVAKFLSIPFGTVARRLYMARQILAAKLGAAAKKPGERALCFDALVAACIEHGLYLTTDLFVSRRGISWRSVGEDRDGEIDDETFKHLVPVHEGVWSNFAAFARNFLGHENPYTGRTLAEEPAMVGLSLVNPLKSPDLGGRACAAFRFFDRPFTISEWNYCGPGRYRGLGGIATGVEAALQDWSGLWRFAWGHGVSAVTHPEQRGLGPFDIANDPLQRASDLACVFLFLCGDLAPLDDAIVVGFPRSSLAVVQPKGSKYADEDMNILLSWGDHRRMVMRRGMAGISLRVAPGDYVVHALNADGTRRGVLPARMEDGRLRFTAS